MAVRKTKYEMPEQTPQERIKNFNEVPYGYSKHVAVEEAKRCLQCKNKPCMNGCPVEIDIPDFINSIAQGEFDKAAEIIKAKSNAVSRFCRVSVSKWLPLLEKQRSGQSVETITYVT